MRSRYVRTERSGGDAARRLLLCLSLILVACGPGGSDSDWFLSECRPLGATSPPYPPLHPGLHNIAVQLEVKFLSLPPAALADLGAEWLLAPVDEPFPAADGATNGTGQSVASTRYVVGGGAGAWMAVPRHADAESWMPTLFPNGSGPFPGYGVFAKLKGPGCVTFDSGASFPLSGMPDNYLGQTLATYPDPGDYQVAFQHLSMEDRDTLLAALGQEAGAVIAPLPDISVRAGQFFTAMVEDYSGNPASFAPEFAQAAQQIEPGVQVLHTGPTLLAQTLAAPPFSHVQLRYVPMGAGASFFGSTFPVLDNLIPSAVQVPLVQPARVTTTVTMPDGGTILLGGIKPNVSSSVDVGLPLFSRIPFLGSLFAQSPTLPPDQPLLIMITARLGDPP